LYLKGISTGGFSEALTALLGRDAPGLSAGTISRLKAVWQEEHARWEKRSLAHQRYVYLWVDGIHFGVRLEEANQCLLVVNFVDGVQTLQKRGAAVVEIAWRRAHRQGQHQRPVQKWC
jgi:transposase-like protein